LSVSAWQNPTDACLKCGQDILLRPEITSDVRMIHVRYCPRCDGGEPIVESGERPRRMRMDAELIWGNRTDGPNPPLQHAASAHGAGSGSAGAAASRHHGAQDGVDLWWDGDGAGSPRHGQLTGMDARWARFAADGSGGSSDDDDDEMSMASEGSFSFDVDGGRRRRARFALPHRVRQSA
jgi:hypothetical protein